jgi:hypothetical protein
MKIPTQMFSEIVASLDASRAAAPGKEQRRASRLDLQHSAAVITYDGGGGRSAPVCINDLSPRGVSLVHPSPMTPGEQFVLHLPRGNGGEPMPMLCTVAYCKPNEDNPDEGFRIGAEFVCALESASARATRAARVPQQREIDRIRQSILA